MDIDFGTTVGNLMSDHKDSATFVGEELQVELADMQVNSQTISTEPLIKVKSEPVTDEEPVEFDSVASNLEELECGSDQTGAPAGGSKHSK